MILNWVSTAAIVLILGCGAGYGETDFESLRVPVRKLRTEKKTASERPSGLLRFHLVDREGRSIETADYCAIGAYGRVDLLRRTLRSGEVMRLPPGEIALVIVPTETAPYYAEVQTTVQTNELTDLTVQVEELRIRTLKVQTVTPAGEAIPHVGVTCTSVQYKGIWWDGCTDKNGMTEMRAVSKGNVVVRARGQSDVLLRTEEVAVSMGSLGDDPVRVVMVPASPSLTVTVRATVQEKDVPFEAGGRLTVQIQNMALTNATVTRSAFAEAVTFYDLPDGTYKVTRVTLPYSVGTTTGSYQYLTQPMDPGEGVSIGKDTRPQTLTLRVPKWPVGKGRVFGSVAGGSKEEFDRCIVKVTRTGNAGDEAKVAETTLPVGGNFRVEVPGGYYDMEAFVGGQVRGRIKRILVLPGQGTGPHALNISQ